MFLRHLYPEKPGNVTLGKISSSRLYLVCGRAETENHISKHAVDTNLARSTRKRLQATTRDASNNPITMYAETYHPVSAWEERYGMFILGFVTSDNSERKGFMERQQEAATPRLLLRIPEAAKALGLGRTKIYELIAAGELPVIHVGRAVRVSVTALQKWVEEQDHQQMSA